MAAIICLLSAALAMVQARPLARRVMGSLGFVSVDDLANEISKHHDSDLLRSQIADLQILGNFGMKLEHDNLYTQRFPAVGKLSCRTCKAVATSGQCLNTVVVVVQHDSIFQFLSQVLE